MHTWGRVVWGCDCVCSGKTHDSTTVCCEQSKLMSQTTNNACAMSVNMCLCIWLVRCCVGRTYMLTRCCDVYTFMCINWYMCVLNVIPTPNWCINKSMLRYLNHYMCHHTVAHLFTKSGGTTWDPHTSSHRTRTVTLINMNAPPMIRALLSTSSSNMQLINVTCWNNTMWMFD